MSPSRRSSSSSRGGGSGRGSRSSRGGRDEEREERGGRSGRGRGRSSTGSFGSILLVGIVLFFLISGVALFVYSHNLNTKIADDTGMKSSYDDWIKQCQDGLQSRAGMLADQLKPIYQDNPTERQSPEVIAKLATQYGPTLTATTANYAWCKKSWTVGSDAMSANISPGNAQKFMQMPSACIPLDDGKTISLSSINGSLAQSGVISLYYDLDEKQPIAVLQLNLAPTPGTKPAEEGAKPSKPLPPTLFVLWFRMPEPSSSGMAHLRKLLQSAK